MSSANTQPTLFDAPKPGSNMPEFSVTEISRALKRTVEDSFSQIRVHGEISECKYHSNGHIYITLKDDGAVLAAVCWRGQAGKLGVKPEIGIEVICTGSLTTYGGQSKYQMVIQGMALAGIGALLKLLEDRKKKLAAEGLFDADKKRTLPFLPNTIGVITSPTGAVIRDILHRLADRFPRHVLVWPVAVQGVGAADQVAAAIAGFNNLAADGATPRPDLLIVARGGGSVEDLMAFNEESVVRAVAKSRIPVISAVGHETDTTLIDFAADRRAPTPTAAAEMAVPVRDNLIAQVMDNGARLFQAMRRRIDSGRERLGLIDRALGDPMRAIEPLLQKLDERFERLVLAGQGMMERRQATVSQAAAKLRHPRDHLILADQRLHHLKGRMGAAIQTGLVKRQHGLQTLTSELAHLSPRAVLGRGYALIQNAGGHVVVSSQEVNTGDMVRIEWADGVKDGKIE